MKHVTSLLLAAGTLIAADIQGQGFAYLSNTNQTVNSSNWTADLIEIPFTTGANASGYLLNSVTLLFASNDIPVLTTAEVFDSSTRTFFQNGVDVGAAGYYTLAPDSPLSLAADTPYLMIVFPADVFASVNWNYTSSSTVTSVDDWSASLTDGSEIPLFTIAATPIAPAPEPAVVPLVCLGAFVFISFQIRTPATERNGDRAAPRCFGLA